MGYPHAKSAAIPNDRLTPASFAGTTAEKDARLIVQAGASHSIRRATMAMATLWPTLVMTACQPGDAAAGSPTPSKTPTTTASSSTALRTCAAHPKVAGAAYGSPVRLSPAPAPG